MVYSGASNKISPKRALVVQDYCCFGKCSLSIAQPVLAAAGVQVTALPVAAFSAHTGYADPAYRDLSGFAMDAVHHLAGLGAEFDAVYVGYLSSKEQFAAAAEAVRLFAAKGTLLLIDPAMGDGGKLYRGVDPALPALMAQLCAKADVVLPNLTETALLLQIPYHACLALTQEERIARLSALGPRQVVLTGVQEKANYYTIVASNGQVTCLPNRRLPGQFHGTGDLFAAAMLGAMLCGFSTVNAAQLAGTVCEKAVKATIEQGQQEQHGLLFESGLPQYLQALGLLEPEKES